ncbi:type II 3-dehydroquinate dehydratase [Rhizobium sp. CRIBSB]|nr:type II 3-dehydroquinate dehydratase [Rhizobium sp. CRIBSB]
MTDTPVLYVLNGPNLNLLGEREPEIYGRETLADIEALCREAAGDVCIEFRQSNHEGQLVDWIQEARLKAIALVINPAAYSHTSVAILDALKALKIPVVECHLSDPATRESFRHHSYASLAATEIVKGHGARGYALAVRSALKLAHERATA